MSTASFVAIKGEMDIFPMLTLRIQSVALLGGTF